MRSLTLDASGTAKLAIDKLPPIDRPASLLVEMEYSDPNGEMLAVATRVPLHPSGIYVGIKPEGWAASKKCGARAGRRARPRRQAARRTARSASTSTSARRYSNRRRLVGGFYAYDTDDRNQARRRRAAPARPTRAASCSAR